MSSKHNNLYEFDEYVLNAKEKNLWRKNELIKMPPKVFDTLCLLVENHGKVLSKNEMIDAIWGDTFVEENNLSQNISALRKIFGKEKTFIETVPTKGFRFAETVTSSVIENNRSIATNQNENYIVATQTKTQIIEETSFEDTDISANSPKLPEPQKAKRNYLGLAIITLLITSIMGFLAYNFYYLIENSKPKTLSSTFDFVELTDTGGIGKSAISPDGKFVAFSRSPLFGNDDKITLHLMEIATGNDVEVKVGNNLIPDFIQFSPDNNSIFFRTSGKPEQFKNVYKVSRFGGTAELVAKNVWGYFGISPDGTKLSYFSKTANGTKQYLIIKNLENGEERVVLERSSATGFYVAVAPFFSPDSKKIGYVPVQKTDVHPNFTILDLEAKNEEIVETDFSTLGQIIWSRNGKGFYLLANEKGKQYQIWNLSYPEKKLTRVTSDSNAYRYIGISNDGKIISANRLSMHSNLWVLPEGKLANAKQITEGENEVGGLLTVQYAPNGEILFNARKNDADTIWAIDPETKEQRRLTEKNIGINHNFAFSKKRNSVFYKFKNQIWAKKLDDSEPQKLDLGDAESFSQPAISANDEWLYFVERKNSKTSIRKFSLENNQNELITECLNYSPETFLSASPDGKYLAFEYVTPKNKNANKTARNVRKFGFLNLETSDIKIIEVPAYRPILRWTENGKSFDYPSYTKTASAILRQSIEEKTPPKTILKLEDEIIYRFDWSPDKKNLAIGRGKYKMDLVVLKPSK